MSIVVLCTGDDFWPLPWYFRGYSNVLWANKVNDNTGRAALIFASPAVEEELANQIVNESIPFEQRHAYFYMFEDFYVWLRPQVRLLGFVRKDILDKHRAATLPDLDELIKNSSKKCVLARIFC